MIERDGVLVHFDPKADRIGNSPFVFVVFEGGLAKAK